MALKRKITKEQHTALDPKLQAEYKAEGDVFVLDAEGFDDPSDELKRAKDREADNAKKEKARADKAEADLREQREQVAKASGNVADLEKSYKEKETLREKEHKAEIAKRDKHLQATLVDSVANKLAAELGGDNAALLMPHITPRLTADLSGDTPLTRVLDKDGKPSAFSVEDLKKEIASDARFKAVVIASKASGAGATGAQKQNGAGGAGNQKPFAQLNDKERAEWYKLDPAGFQQAADANKQAMIDRPAAPRAF